MYLNWQDRPEDYYALDIETDSLEATRIWCTGWKNIKTDEKGMFFTRDDVRNFFNQTKGSKYVGHNLIKFDAPVLNRLYGTGLGPSNCIDTLVLSTLYNPSLEGGHSLGAWAERLGKKKLDHDDWSRLSQEMITYCHMDVEITAELFKGMTRVLKTIGFSEQSCEIQHKFTGILERQRKNGFWFNGPEAMAFYQKLRTREAELQEQIREVFPDEERLVRVGNVRTQSGSFTAIYQRDLERYRVVPVKGDPSKYEAFERIPFNIGSPKQRVEKLTALGWVADDKTPKGQPKLTEKSALKFAETSGIPEVGLITKWMSVNGRANMINNWLDLWDEDTNCIHGSLFVANTLRLRHQRPNTANVPAVRLKEIKDESGKVIDTQVLYGEDGYYTYEARDLWTARPDRVLVGTDAAGLELRMLAHYLNRPDFTAQVLDGDPHQYNADTAGVTRPRAKTLLYAIQYGAQAGKVASIIEGSLAEGAAMRTQFLERLGLDEIMEQAIHEQETGRVWLVDGSGVVCPSPHAALNYKFQGGGARVMALGAIILDGYIRSDGLDSLKVGDIHDEWQFDVAPSDAKQHALRSVQAIREAGEALNFNLPLDGTAKIGKTWAETH